MKSQNVHLLLGVLLFASLCGAPQVKSKKATLETHLTRFKGKHPASDKTEGAEIAGTMSSSKKSGSLGREKLKKENKEKLKKENKAATKIQKTVRGHQARKKLMKSDALFTSASSGAGTSKISTPRPASKKEQKAARTIQKSIRARQSKNAAAKTDAVIVDPTEAFLG